VQSSRQITIIIIRLVINWLKHQRRQSLEDGGAAVSPNIMDGVDAPNNM
jgi:hypothetical protein